MAESSKRYDIAAEGVCWGPSWKKNETGDWLLPEHSIGLDVIEWCEDNLCQPDGPNTGDPWRFTDEQLRLIMWIYAVNDEGKFLFNEIIIQRMKGWGKDPFCSAICAVELLGPARFSHFDQESGSAVGRRHPSPWIQTAAVSKEQTQNTFLLFPNLFSQKLQDLYGMEIGKEKLYAVSRGPIHAVTSSARSLEGGRSTLVLANETGHWLNSNGGHDMDRVTKRNLAKSRDGQARLLKITNAPLPGDDSVAERDWYAFTQSVEGRLKNYRVLYDSLEAPADTRLEDPDSLRRGITVARGDSVWLNVDRVMEAVYDINTPPQVSRRFYLNQIVAAEDAWIKPQDWDSLAEPDQVVPDGEEIVAFFDGSRTDDSTGIVGVRMSDGHVFTIDVWEHPSSPDKERWEVPRAEVDARVSWMFDHYKVMAFYCDLKDWESYVDKWRDEFGHLVAVQATTGEGKTSHPFAWDMRSHVPQFTKAAERFVADVEAGALTHDGSFSLRRHVHNARRAPNRWGVSLAKEHRESSRKIDLAVCAVGARQAWRDVKAIQSAARKKNLREPGKAYSFS